MSEGENKFGKYVIFEGERDDIDYKLWLQENPNAFVLNDNKYNHARLHTAQCFRIMGEGHVQNVQWKICAWKIDVLKQYCREKEKGFELKSFCKSCKPLEKS